MVCVYASLYKGESCQVTSKKVIFFGVTVDVSPYHNFEGTKNVGHDKGVFSKRISPEIQK